MVTDSVCNVYVSTSAAAAMCADPPCLFVAQMLGVVRRTFELNVQRGKNNLALASKLEQYIGGLHRLCHRVMGLSLENMFGQAHGTGWPSLPQHGL